MPPLAYFGIESSGLNLVIDLLILFVVVLYLSLIYWTYADARRRILDPMLVGCATAASLFPFVGTIVYVILRPPEYLEDVRERELEMQAAEVRLHDMDSGLCPHCDYRIERDFIRCPSCLRKLKERCVSCGRPLDQAWTICPYCETEVPGVMAPTRRQRRGPRAAPDEDSLSFESEPALTRDISLSAEDLPPEDTLPAVTPAAGAPDEEVRAKPVAAPGPVSSGSRGAGRARRPRRTA
jgi:Double zinc ribbon